MSTNKRLYLGHIPGDASKHDVEDFFRSYGKVNDIRLMAGFGFIEFDDVRDAEDAVREANGRDFRGERILVEFAKAPRSFDGPPRERFDNRSRPGGNLRFPPRGSGYRLTISGLADGTSWQDLKDFARSAGQPAYADVSRNNPSEGTIEFVNKSEYDAALATLDGTDLNGARVRVEGNFPLPNGEPASASAGESYGGDRRSSGYGRRGDDRNGHRDRDYDRRPRDDDRDFRRRDDDGYRRRDDDRGSYRRRSRSRSRTRSPPPPRRSKDRSRSPAPRSSRDDKY